LVDVLLKFWYFVEVFARVFGVCSNICTNPKEFFSLMTGDAA